MVSQWTWKHGQQPENDYVFSYDGVGRMVAAKHFVDGARTDGYTERGIRYDANGNLLAISRTAGGAVSDSLRFTLGGDVLLDVSGTSTGVFEYDPSGNLVKDGLNRLEFSYNCLNLMQTVQTTVGASKAQFTYGSDGRKLSEKARTGGFEYLGSLIYAYRGRILDLVQAVTDEGTIQSAGVNYFIRDHLGSVRAVVDHTGKIVERNDYYPFGGRHENASLPLTGVNRYKFGGKETLEPVSLDMLDFGARFYDPRIARWNTQDPLAEQNPSVSLYAYCSNNPISRIDPDGMLDDWVERGNRVVFDPDIHGPNDPKLQSGDHYLGASYQVVKDGNTITDYRSDGSIMFSQESYAYKRMVGQSNSTGNESFMAMTDKGFLVLPDYDNSRFESLYREYGYEFVNGNLQDPFGTTYKIFGTVHTHPNGGPPSRDAVSNYGDLAFASYCTPNKPAYVLRLNGENKVSFIVAHPNLPRNPKNFKYKMETVTDSYPDANVTNVLNGRFSLKKFTIQNRVYFNNYR